MAYTNETKPTDTYTGDTKPSAGTYTDETKPALGGPVTWAAITTTWASESGTWAVLSQDSGYVNETKPS